jgi:hypothetical protein
MRFAGGITLIGKTHSRERGLDIQTQVAPMAALLGPQASSLLPRDRPPGFL